MRTKVRKKMRCISCKGPNDFEKSMNQLFDSLEEPEVQIDQNLPFTAYVFYEELEEIPETVEDEFLLRGEKYYCNDCPYFEPSSDGRVKYTNCRYSSHRVGASTRACELFYKRLIVGELKTK